MFFNVVFLESKYIYLTLNAWHWPLLYTYNQNPTLETELQSSCNNKSTLNLHRSTRSTFPSLYIKQKINSSSHSEASKQMAKHTRSTCSTEAQRHTCPKPPTRRSKSSREEFHSNNCKRKRQKQLLSEGQVYRLESNCSRRHILAPDQNSTLTHARPNVRALPCTHTRACTH